MKRLVRALISVVLLGVSVVGLVFFVWPQYQEFSSLRTQVKERKERLEEGQRILAELKRVQAEASVHQEDFAKLEQAVPQDAALPVLYDHIQQLVANSGLVLESVSGQEQLGPNDEVVALVFQVSFTGSYEALKNFLDQTRRSSRILHVTSLSIGGGGSEESNLLHISVELAAYAAP